MTDKIQAIIERSTTDIVKVPIISAVVNRDGVRAVDTAKITMPAGTKVSTNDIVSYIQDDVPLTHLIGLWNFQGSTRDESGFHHDGAEYPDSGYRNLPANPDEGYIIPNGTGNTRAYRGNYGLTFTAVNQKVTVPDNTNTAVLDLENSLI